MPRRVVHEEELVVDANAGREKAGKGMDERPGSALACLRRRPLTDHDICSVEG